MALPKVIIKSVMLAVCLSQKKISRANSMNKASAVRAVLVLIPKSS
ncbi:Uncharacterised protein [Vibrio cholerae]|nr:Uncharacterised protein [Vibrio cholerae]